jgi:hypothetical protein
MTPRLDEQGISVMRALGAKLESCGRLAQSMPREGGDGLMAKSDERHRQAAAMPLDWLGLRQGPNVG